MTSLFLERQRALANDWRDLVVEAMEHQKAEQNIPPTNPETAELVQMVDALIDRHLNHWKWEIQAKIGTTRNGVALTYPQEVLMERLQTMFIERLNAMLPRPFYAKDLDARGRWRDCFEVNWIH